MAFQAKDGKSFTNRPPMMAHNRSMERKSMAGGMGMDPLASPGMEKQGASKPDMIHVHNKHDGTYHTQHEPDGSEHDHQNLEALKQHFDQFLSEEESEGDHAEGDEPQYE